ncbi:hypothetical protein [Mesorhizobium sp. M2D.F.Ca.ET.223.01.1.1]|uniref:hypothetical protein n=1 Tax=Mesorhizobium sp. M2D.F.Ca.ET.223.01.1.1 TaxID=2563940 RepID=UPI00142EBDD0|nr:hypothetical protein [Mesorhizobium sp. M2D.F.Ca.ET.223.01.1.1]
MKATVVTKAPNGAWVVMSGAVLLAGPFDDSSSAWRWLDRYEGEPVSRGEQTAEFVFRKMWVTP